MIDEQTTGSIIVVAIIYRRRLKAKAAAILYNGASQPTIMPDILISDAVLA